MSAATTPIAIADAGRHRTKPWLRAAAALFAVAWGGNEFTPLLVTYRMHDNLGALTVNVLLGAYVIGIVPALLLGGPLSDRFGRRPLLLPAPLIALAGSAVLAAAAGEPVLLFAGRVLSGVALGLVMAVGTAWIKELSEAPFDASPSGSGARRAALSLTTGFALGAAVAAALAQFAPLPEVLPYLVNVALCAASFAFALRTPESHPRDPARGGRLRDDLRIPSASHRRFLGVVAPMSPWVFGTAASAYAILPALLVDRVAGFEVGFAGLMCLVSLGCGVGAQTLARRIDLPGGCRGVTAALAAVVPGMLLAAATALTRSVALALVAAAALGIGYGLLLVGGLMEVQRIAGPDDLAGLTAVFYSLSYVGFFVPAVLAAISPVIGYPTLFVAGAVIAALSAAHVWRAHVNGKRRALAA